jgi:hypothetical protein
MPLKKFGTIPRTNKNVFMSSLIEVKEILRMVVNFDLINDSKSAVT